MVAKKIKFSVEARDKIQRGIDVLTDAARVTLALPRAATSCSTNRSAHLASPRKVSQSEDG
jgi:hypothetical protein